MAKKFSLESVLTLSDQITAPLGKVSKQMDKFGKTMQKNFGGVGKNIKALDAGINKVAVGIAAVGAAGITASAMLVQSTATQADEWSKTARQIGITTEQLQKLDYVANMQGVSSESLIKSYAKMNKNIGDLKSGSGTLAAYLKKTDAAFLKQLGTVKNSDQAFIMLMGKINEAPDEFAKAALAQAAFGKAGMDMLRVAEAGADGIAALMGETEKYGLISTDAANASEVFLDEQSRIKQMLIGLKNQAFNALIPVLTNILEKLRKLFETSADGTDIIGRFKKMVEGIDIDSVVRGVSNFAKGMVKLGSVIGKVVGFLATFWPVILAVVAAIKILAVVQTAYNAVLLITNILASPITLTVLAVVAAVALLAAGVYLMVKHWDKVLAVLKVVGSAIAGFFIGAWNGLIDVLKVVGGFFKSTGQALMKWMLTPINLVMDALGGLLTMLSKIPGVGDKIKPAVAALDGLQSKFNTTLTGSANAYDYAAPFTKTSETRSVQESRQTSVNEIYVRPDKGASISSTRGGAPSQVLMYGAAQ